jgi:protein gp37
VGEVTAISWCDHTWNPWIGCTKVSPACDGCYAEQLMDKRHGRVEWGAPGKGVGTRSRTSASTWNDPFRWHRKAEKAGTRPFVFCASLADIFDNQVPAEWRAEAFEVMRRTPRLVYLLLTKRPQNIVGLCRQAGGLPRNAALGTTVEDQKRFDTNVPALRAAKHLVDPAFAFLSCEPLLGPVAGPLHGIDWVITGGETDQGEHKARPSHPSWFRSLRDQTDEVGAAFHHKQNGEWMPRGYAFALGLIPEPYAPVDGRNIIAPWGSSDVVMARVGKRLSGRLVDFVLHDARPEVPAHD